MLQVNVTIGFNAETLAAINNLIGLTTAEIETAPEANGSAKAVPVKPLPKPEPVKSGQDAVEEIKVTLEQLRELSASKSKESTAKKEKVKALIAEMGGKNVSTLPEENYNEFYSKLQAL